MRGRRKRALGMALLMLLLVVSLGYALLATNLDITGITNVNKSTWDIYWDNIEVRLGSTTPDSPTQVDPQDNTKITFTANLTVPGDYYEFTVDAVNNGTIDAMVDSFYKTVKLNNEEIELPPFIKYEITYADRKEVLKDHLLQKKNGDEETREKYRVRVEILKSITNEELASIPVGGFSYVFSYGVKYVQADENAIDRAPVAVSFATDSWEHIIDVVRYGRGNTYPVGATRVLPLDLDGDGVDENYDIRVLNNTMPDICRTEGYSQTACGFVIGFVNGPIFSTMNPSATNNGGYPNTVAYNEYLENNSPHSIYKAFPPELKEGVVDTYTVSGNETGGTENYITIDKLYLLSPVEIYGPEYHPEYDTAIEFSHQLDYFRINNTSSSNRTPARMNYMWWHRTPVGTNRFSSTNYAGSINDVAANSGELLIAPAFRISY